MTAIVDALPVPFHPAPPLPVQMATPGSAVSFAAALAGLTTADHAAAAPMNAPVQPAPLPALSTVPVQAGADNGGTLATAPKVLPVQPAALPAAPVRPSATPTVKAGAQATAPVARAVQPPAPVRPGVTAAVAGGAATTTPMAVPAPPVAQPAVPAPPVAQPAVPVRLAETAAATYAQPAMANVAAAPATASPPPQQAQQAQQSSLQPRTDLQRPSSPPPPGPVAQLDGAKPAPAMPRTAFEADVPAGDKSDAADPGATTAVPITERAALADVSVMSPPQAETPVPAAMPAVVAAAITPAIVAAAVTPAVPQTERTASEAPRAASTELPHVAVPGPAPAALPAAPLVRAPDVPAAGAAARHGEGPAKAGADPLPGGANTIAVSFAAAAAPTASAPTAPASPVVPTGAPLPERQLDLSGDGRWLGELAADIAAVRSDSGALSFRLLPKQLGRIDVAIETGASGLVIAVAAETEVARNLLTGASQKLVAELTQAGVRVEQTSVTTLSSHSGNAASNNGNGNGQAPRDQRDTPHAAPPASEPSARRADADRPLSSGPRSRFA